MKKILVIVDMQNDFVTGSLGNEECKHVVTEVVDVICKGEYDEVLLTRDTHHDDYLTTQEGKKLPVEHCFENTYGWEVVDEIRIALQEKYANDNEKVRYFNKHVFGSVELAEYLQKQELENKDLTIDFVGVCTGICVISNVLLAKAFCKDANVRVINRACACVTPQSHDTAIQAMKNCQVEIIT